jgi:2-keto-4-pentenoate hydratase/2-oxohepta-3-ene-1,7-dioic acid hydratase in catechol pathway
VRIARFSTGEEIGFGVVEGGGDDVGSGGELAVIAGHPFGGASLTFTGQRVPLSAVKLLPPTLPSKVVAIGKNYAEHAAEMGSDVPDQPLFFLKPSTAVIGPEQAVKCPPSAQRVDYEGELAVVIGRLCQEVPAARALDVVLGYTCANDVTARDQQKADGQWSRAKGYDTFCPLGPWIETELDTSDLSIRTLLSGEVKQDGRTSDIVHRIPELIEYVTRCMTLLPGDVLLTGTPHGVGPMQAGDTVEVSIEGIGTLRNPVVARG